SLKSDAYSDPVGEPGSISEVSTSKNTSGSPHGAGPLPPRFVLVRENLELARLRVGAVTAAAVRAQQTRGSRCVPRWSVKAVRHQNGDVARLVQRSTVRG